jgi:prepilin-type N-terminal cleavage/methylation domain-containing protein
MKEFTKKYFTLKKNKSPLSKVKRARPACPEFCRGELVEGFTLIETLVAVAILLIAVVGPMKIADQGAKLGVRSRDELTASYLAQDAIEFIRYRITTNMNAGMVNPVTGDADLPTCLSTATPPKCAVDTVTDGIGGTVGKIYPCDVSGVCPNLIWTDTGSTGFSRYGLTAGTSTDFVREVTITPYTTGGAIYDQTNDPPNTKLPSEWYISATVSWGRLGETGKTLTVGENVVDWRIVTR